MGKQWKKCQTLFLWAPKSLQMVTAAMKSKDAYSLEGKYDQPDSVLKSRDMTLPTEVHLVKAMVFPVVMYGYKSWTVKKAECRRIDAFELWCWRRLLRVPWTARSLKQSILNISPWCSLEGQMLKLKLQYFGHLMRRADSFEKIHLKRLILFFFLFFFLICSEFCHTLKWNSLGFTCLPHPKTHFKMLGKIEGRKRRGWQRMRWLDGITNSMDMSLGKSENWWWTGRPGMLQFMGLQRVRHDWVTELNWIEWNIFSNISYVWT